MAKRKTLTLDDLQEEFERMVMERLDDIEETIAEKYEIECWDDCLDGQVWNKNLHNMAKQWVDAIVSNRDWDSKGDVDWKITVDFSKALKRKELEQTIKQAKRALEELE